MSDRLHIDEGHPDTASHKAYVLCVGNEKTGDRWREVARTRSKSDALHLCDGWNAADEIARLRALNEELVQALELAWEDWGEDNCECELCTCVRAALAHAKGGSHG